MSIILVTFSKFSTTILKVMCCLDVDYLNQYMDHSLVLMDVCQRGIPMV